MSCHSLFPSLSSFPLDSQACIAQTFTPATWHWTSSLCATPARRGCVERWWSLHPCRCSKAIWTWWPCLGRERGGLGDLQVPSSLSQSVILSQRAYCSWRAVERFACAAVLAPTENSRRGIREKKSEKQALLYNRRIGNHLSHIL